MISTQNLVYKKYLNLKVKHQPAPSSEVLVLKFWKVWSHPSLPLLPGRLIQSKCSFLGFHLRAKYICWLIIIIGSDYLKPFILCINNKNQLNYPEVGCKDWNVWKIILKNTAFEYFAFHIYIYTPSDLLPSFSNKFIYIYIYIYICVCVKVKLATLVEGDPKAPFSIATTRRCRGRYSIPYIAPLYPWSLPYSAKS